MNFLKNISLYPSDYVQAAFLARDVGIELESRLELLKLTPAIILDLGCGPAEISQKLKSRYPQAEVIGIDHSQALLNFSKKHTSNINFITADANYLPLKNASVDLIVANFLIPWLNDRQQFFKECQRVLRPQGIILFSTLGLDTLPELQKVIGNHLPCFADMHDIGDDLVHAGLTDPVVDVSHYTVTYKNYEKLMTELYASELLVSIPEVANQPLLFANAAHEWVCHYEVIFAHAFKPAHKFSMAKDGTVKIPIEQLKSYKKKEKE